MPIASPPPEERSEGPRLEGRRHDGRHWKKTTRFCGARSSGQARGLRARCARACFKPSFAGLVVLAGSLYPIPSRTRPLNFPAPMVLSLKTWKSRSLPGLPRTEASSRFLLKHRRGFLPRRFFVATCRPRATRQDHAVHTAATQSISTSNGPCQAPTQMKLRAGGSEGK